MATHLVTTSTTTPSQPSGTSNVSWATLGTLIVSAVGLGLGFYKTWHASRDAKVAAESSLTASTRSANAAQHAADTAADALKETTRLSAQLTDTSELQRWRRNRLVPVISEMLEASDYHMDHLRDELQFNDIVLNAGSSVSETVEKALVRRNEARKLILDDMQRILLLCYQIRLMADERVKERANSLLDAQLSYKPIAQEDRHAKEASLAATVKRVNEAQLALIEAARDELIFVQALSTAPVGQSQPPSDKP